MSSIRYYPDLDNVLGVKLRIPEEKPSAWRRMIDFLTKENRDAEQDDYAYRDIESAEELRCLLGKREYVCISEDWVDQLEKAVENKKVDPNGEIFTYQLMFYNEKGIAPSAMWLSWKGSYEELLKQGRKKRRFVLI